jgi:GTP pyrophosphokinase
MDAQWQVPEKAGHTYHTDLHILCDDKEGLLAEIYRVFQEEKIKITSLNVRTDKSLALFNVGVEVTDGEHLTRLFAKLRKEFNVHELSRVNA